MCLMPPNIWTDGSLVLEKVSGASSSGSRFFPPLPGIHWVSRRWGHLDDVGHDGWEEGRGPSCRGFCSVPGLLQTVKRVEF